MPNDRTIDVLSDAETHVSPFRTLLDRTRASRQDGDALLVDLKDDDVDDPPTLRPTATVLFVAASTPLAVLFVYDYAPDLSLVAFQQYGWPLAIAVVVLVV